MRGSKLSSGENWVRSSVSPHAAINPKASFHTMGYLTVPCNIEEFPINFLISENKKSMKPSQNHNNKQNL
jgi:hypothetical protein